MRTIKEFLFDFFTCGFHGLFSCSIADIWGLGFSEFYGKLIPFLSIVGGVGLNLTIKLFGREDVDLSGPMNLVDMCHQFILKSQEKEVQTSEALVS